MNTGLAGLLLTNVPQFTFYFNMKNYDQDEVHHKIPLLY